MADSGNTMRFITTKTTIPYAAPAIHGAQISQGNQTAVTQKTVAAENAITKWSTNPSAPVVQLFSNERAPISPLATFCQTRKGGTFRSANETVAAIASRIPQTAPPQAIARTMS